MPKIRTLFCLVDIKECSFLTSCVFWFAIERVIEVEVIEVSLCLDRELKQSLKLEFSVKKQTDAFYRER